MSDLEDDWRELVTVKELQDVIEFLAPHCPDPQRDLLCIFISFNGHIHLAMWDAVFDAEKLNVVIPRDIFDAAYAVCMSEDPPDWVVDTLNFYRDHNYVPVA